VKENTAEEFRARTATSDPKKGLPSLGSVFFQNVTPQQKESHSNMNTAEWIALVILIILVLLVLAWLLRGCCGSGGYGFNSKGGAIKLYSVPGTYTYCLPACHAGKKVKVTVYGGGGGGGGGISIEDDTNVAASGGGGGAGATIITEIECTHAGQKFAITVGAGGAGGAGVLNTTPSNPGLDGTLSKVTVKGLTYQANGGGGGAAADTTVTTVAGGLGGTTSVPTSAEIIAAINGQDGHVAENTFDILGGNGGASAFGSAGGQGGSPVAPANPDAPTDLEILAMSGLPGQTPGAGGGGGSGSSAGGTGVGSGGAGANGFVIIEIL